MSDQKVSALEKAIAEKLERQAQMAADVAANKAKQEAVTGQSFSSVKRIEHINGNIVYRTNNTRYSNFKGNNVRDMIIPLHRAQAELTKLTDMRDAMMRLGERGWMELGDICEEFSARIKEALAFREKHNVPPSDPYL